VRGGLYPKKVRMVEIESVSGDFVGEDREHDRRSEPGSIELEPSARPSSKLWNEMPT
jgi:hypothetical protein